MRVKGFLKFLLKDIYIKILALLIAILIYFNAAMEHSQTLSLRIPIIFRNLTEGQVIADKTTDRAILTIEGKGKDFIGLHPNRLKFNLDLSNSKPGNKKIKLLPEELGLPSTVTLKNIDPEYVELNIDRLSKKPVQVTIPYKGKLEKGYALVNIMPKTDVSLIGPKEELGFISIINTESLSLSDLRESKDMKLKIILPEGDNFSVEPNSLEISIQIEKEIARIFLAIPLEIKGSATKLVSMRPNEAQIAVSGPESKLKTLKTNEIIAQLNIENLEPGTHEVRAEITLPPGINLVKCEPAFFQVKIR